MTKMTNKDISEVAQPVSGDEKAFVAKHKVKVTDHPAGTKLPPITTSKKKRLADPEDTEVTYEEVVYNVSWCDVNGMNKKETGLAEDDANRLAFRLENTGAVRIKIEEAIVTISEKEMTDAQMKKREDYVKGMKSKSDDLRKRYGKRWKDVMYAIATKNAMREETISEIAKAGEEPLLTQLQKRTNQSEVEVKFHDGKTHTLSRGHANKALSMLSGMKPADREHAHSFMAKSHDHFMKALNGQMPKPGKTGISLAGPKIAKEEVEELDEVGNTSAGKKALGSYIVKAAPEVLGHAYAAGMTNTNDPKTKEKSFKKAFKRVRGIERATKRLAREEVEQIDELGPDTLGRYATKALNRGELAARMSKSDDDDMGKIAKKRLTGAKKAVDRIAPKVAATRIKKNIDKAKEAAANRYTDKDDKGKSYYAAEKGIAKVREEVEALDEVGGQTTTAPVTQPVSRPAPKPVQKKPTPVTEAGDVIPPKGKKMKSFGDTMNNFNLTNTRARTFNVSTAKDRALEMDEEVDHKRAAIAALNGHEDKFHTHMGISDFTPINHPSYVKSKEKYKKIQKLPDEATIGDAIKIVRED
jgi:hypothetical protein